MVGGVPALDSPADSAMEKQEECAAAMSSSGEVLPLASSEREGQDTSKLPTPEDCSSTLPAPSAREPCQVVFAVRVVAMTVNSWGAWVRARPCGRAHCSTPGVSRHRPIGMMDR